MGIKRDDYEQEMMAKEEEWRQVLHHKIQADEEISQFAEMFECDKKQEIDEVLC